MVTPESNPNVTAFNEASWHEQMHAEAVSRFNEVRYGDHPERGALGLRSFNELRKLYPTLVGAAVLGAVVGVAGFFHSKEIIKTETHISAGEGALKSTFELDKECYGGYVNEVKGAKAEINKKLFGKIGTTFKASETFNGDITSEVCNTGVDGEMIVDSKTHKTTVTIPATAFETTVYQTNPADTKAWTSDNGAAVAIMKNFGNTVKVLPGGLDVKAGDELSSKLRGWALLSAYELSSKGCGKTAWPHIKDGYADKIKEKVVTNNNTFNKDIQITPDDVTVNLPDTIAFKNQYEAQFTDIQSKLAKADVKFAKIDPNSFVCKDMPAGGTK